MSPPDDQDEPDEAQAEPAGKIHWLKYSEKSESRVFTIDARKLSKLH
jgi:hypothetical protein